MMAGGGERILGKGERDGREGMEEEKYADLGKISLKPRVITI
jgi:hypothetical protein